jgi:membrane fusion protein, heavy metal efflux system
VQPADGVFLIADLSRVWVVADVPEQNAGAVRIGESVQADIPGLDNRRLQGSISFVSPTVNPETRTIRARMEVANAAREFKPAMLAMVLMRGAPQTSLVIPVGAVVREDNRDYAFVQTGASAFQLREIKLGIEYEGRRVVQDGLRSSDTIVVDGAFHLNNERKRRATQGG